MSLPLPPCLMHAQLVNQLVHCRLGYFMLGRFHIQWLELLMGSRSCPCVLRHSHLQGAATSSSSKWIADAGSIWMTPHGKCTPIVCWGCGAVVGSGTQQVAMGRWGLHLHSSRQWSLLHTIGRVSVFTLSTSANQMACLLPQPPPSQSGQGTASNGGYLLPHGLTGSQSCVVPFRSLPVWSAWGGRPE